MVLSDKKLVFWSRCRPRGNVPSQLPTRHTPVPFLAVDSQCHNAPQKAEKMQILGARRQHLKPKRQPKSRNEEKS